MGSEETHTGLQGEPRPRCLPRAMFDCLYVLSPVSGVDCPRCRTRTGGADRRHGRGARTTRLRRTLRRFRLEPKPLTPQASIATAQRPSWRHGLRRKIVPICGIVKRDFGKIAEWAGPAVRAQRAERQFDETLDA